MPWMTMNGIAVDYLAKLLNDTPSDGPLSDNRRLALDELRRQTPADAERCPHRPRRLLIGDDAYETIQTCLRDAVRHTLSHPRSDVPSPAAPTPFERRAVAMLAAAFDVHPVAEAAAA